jgi:hypothetical protein
MSASSHHACGWERFRKPPLHRADGRGLREFIGSEMNKHLNAIRKAGFSSLFTPTKAIRRVRAIAADRTRASLTGGCSAAANFRIYTEFRSAEGEPGRLEATGPGNAQRPLFFEIRRSL